MFPKMVGFMGLLAGSTMLRRIHLQHQIDSEISEIMKLDQNRVEIEDLGLKPGPNESPGCSESNGSSPDPLKPSIILQNTREIVQPARSQKIYGNKSKFQNVLAWCGNDSHTPWHHFPLYVNSPSAIYGKHPTDIKQSGNFEKLPINRLLKRPVFIIQTRYQNRMTTLHPVKEKTTTQLTVWQ